MTPRIILSLFCLIATLLQLSCSQDPAVQLELLNGYWEIAQIENSHGSVKEYSISQNIDFFEITAQGKGVRKKVQPDLNGNFTTTNAKENIDILTTETTVFLKYSTAFDTWQEEILSVSKEKLRLRNKDNFTYTYRRYQPLSIDVR